MMVAKAGRGPNGPWRLAKSLIRLEAEVNARWPQRRKDSDGSIGDAAHQSRSSDHNPWVHDPDGNDIVTAIDITHDPAGGCDSYALAAALVASRDPRIKYIISNRKIISGKDGPQPWVARAYGGSNPHSHHVHISVEDSKAFYDSEADWAAVGGEMPEHGEPHPAVVPPTLKPGMQGPEISRMQKALGVSINGVYAARSETYFALCLFQIRHNLDPDGICGPMTWEKLLTMGVK